VAEWRLGAVAFGHAVRVGVARRSPAAATDEQRLAGVAFATTRCFFPKILYKNFFFEKCENSK
jgi:hypothetical protein